MGKGVSGEATAGAEGHGRRRQTVTVLAVVSLAFALLLVSIWTARNAAAGQPDSVVNFARLVKIAACFGLAWAFRSYIPPVRTLFWVGAALTAISVGLNGISFLLGPAAPEYLPLGYLTGLFSGVGEACLILVIAHFVAAFPPQLSTVAVPAIYLANEVLFLVLSYAPSATLAWLRPLLELVSVALAAWCLTRLRKHPLGGGVHPVQYGIDGPRDTSEHVLRFLGSSREWVLLLVGTTLFPFVFGAVSQVVGAAQALPGLYDPATEFCAIGLLCLLVGARRAVGVAGVACAVLACVAAGCSTAVGRPGLAVPLAVAWLGNAVAAGAALFGAIAVLADRTGKKALEKGFGEVALPARVALLGLVVQAVGFVAVGVVIGFASVDPLLYWGGALAVGTLVAAGCAAVSARVPGMLFAVLACSAVGGACLRATVLLAGTGSLNLIANAANRMAL